ANDSIGGQAKEIVVHPDDHVSVFDGATASDAPASDGSALRSGITGVGDAKTKGGDGVDVTLHSDAVGLGTAVTDAGGAFSATVTIPKSTSDGRHFIVALVPNTKDG